MSQHGKLKALVYVKNTPRTFEDLKRLALFFDEIHYILPSYPVLNKNYMDNPKYFEWDSTGKPITREFNYFRDTTPFALGTDFDKTFDVKIKETLLAFQEQNIVKHVNLAHKIDDDFKSVRATLASLDIKEDAFNTICGNHTEEYSRLVLQTIQGVLVESGKQYTFVSPITPRAMEDSLEMTDVLYIAQQENLFPIFLDSRSKKLMQYRYNQYKAGLELLKELSSHVVSPADFKASFGEVTFNVANSLFTSDLIAKKTPQEIIKYREEMSHARQRFISENLMEIFSIVQENPWDLKAKDEVEKYIIGKLNKDVEQYKEQSIVTWEKMFGDITSPLATILKSAIVGGGTGGIIGNLIPNTSPWYMILIGALTGLATQLPDLSKSIVQAVLENGKNKRTSISYIANFR